MTTGNPHHKPHRKEESTIKKERVALAKDVIAQLDTKRFIARHGSYLSTVDTGWNKLFSKNRELHHELDRQLQRAELLKLREEFVPPPSSCAVCAIGAMFVAALDVHNKLRLEDCKTSTNGYLNDNDMVSYLQQWFSNNEMRDMEAVFEAESEEEGCLDSAPRALRDEILQTDDGAYEEPHTEWADEIVMRGIMQMIIDSKGAEFVIPEV